MYLMLKQKYLWVKMVELIMPNLFGDETFVHFSDTFHKHPVSKNPHLIIECDSLEELERVYKRLIDDGGHAKVKLNKTF